MARLHHYFKDDQVTQRLPEVRERLSAGGFDPLGGTPEELAAAMRSDFSRYGKIVAEAGIKLE